MKKLKFILPLGAIILSGVAIAQDYTAPATFGVTELEGGFSPDPYVATLTAGGGIEASSRFTNCVGYIAEAPDYSVSFDSGSLPLTFSVDSDADTTLIINDPSGEWWCDDDGAEASFNPMVRFDNPRSGRYDIWVGTFSAGSGVPATLFVSELGEHTRASTNRAGNRNNRITANNRSNQITANTNQPARFTANQGGGNRLDISQTAQSGSYTLEGGFMPDPWSARVMAGGLVDLDAALSNTSGCAGYANTAPTVELRYNGSRTLYIYTDGSVDTTLAVNAPDGSWYCNDDGSGLGLDAGLSLSGSGVYDIYVGKYSGSAEGTQLKVSEIRLGY